MKKQLFTISLALISIFSFASTTPGEGDEKKSTTTSENSATANHMKIYKGLYLTMENAEVEKYIEEELSGQMDSNGEYMVKFFDQNAYMIPKYKDGGLEKVEIIFRSDYADEVESSVKKLESTLSSTEGWKINKASDNQWLFEKKVDTIDNMNQLTIYTYGIHQDGVAGWYSQVQIKPRYIGEELSDDEVSKRSQELQSYFN